MAAGGLYVPSGDVCVMFPQLGEVCLYGLSMGARCVMLGGCRKRNKLGKTPGSILLSVKRYD